MAPQKKKRPAKTGSGKKSAAKKKPGRKKPSGPLGKYSVEILLGVLIGGLTLGILYLVIDGGEKRLTAKAPIAVVTPQPMLHYEEELPPQPVESHIVAPVDPAPEKVFPGPSQAVFTPKPAIAHGPMVAVIIDDLGADMEAARRLLAIDQPISFAVLPYLHHSEGVATLAHAKGREVMLHLPMQPTSARANPGHGALTVDMDDTRLLDAFTRALNEVPFAEGVNNHMGSLFTENADRMKPVVLAIRDAGLFFIDSRTTPRTEATHMAETIGLPTASRDVFLDNDQDVAKITANLRALADQARRNGAAIGIGHPYRQTVEALEKVMPELAKEGIVFVPAGALVGNPE